SFVAYSQLMFLSPATPASLTYTLSLRDALPISQRRPGEPGGGRTDQDAGRQVDPRLLQVRGCVGRAGSPRLGREGRRRRRGPGLDRKSTRLNSSHVKISYAVFCLKKKNEERCLS